MQDQHPDPTKWKEVNVTPDQISELNQLLEADAETTIYFEEEAYHAEELFPALQCESDDLVERPRMKTDSRRTMQQGPKGNIYPSPKRGR